MKLILLIAGRTDGQSAENRYCTAP